jgi:Predicted membrane protein
MESFLLFCFITILCVNALSNRSRIVSLEQELLQLKQQIDRLLRAQKQKAPVQEKEEKASLAGVQENIIPSAVLPVTESSHETTTRAEEICLEEICLEEICLEETRAETTRAEEKKAEPPNIKESFEKRFGARLPVWLGGIALALAGIFLVKYSIDMGFLDVKMRHIIGFLFGAGLAYGGHYVFTKSRFADHIRIGQALSGAGIVALYGCFFSAATLYELISKTMGFSGMALVTIVAVLLSLKQGMPIVLLAFFGGFLTPALVNTGSHNTPMLFLYLYFLVTGMMIVVRRQFWWVLIAPLLGFSCLWVLFWTFSSSYEASDGLYIGLFLVATSLTVVGFMQEKQALEDARFTKKASITGYITFGGAAVLAAFVLGRADFGLVEWGLFGLLAAASLALAFFRQRLYGMLPYATLAVSAILFFLWEDAPNSTYAWIIGAFAVLYVGSGIFAQRHSEKPLLWSGVVSAASLAYFLVAYHNFEWQIEDRANSDFLWGTGALALAGMAVYALGHIMRILPGDHEDKQKILAVYAATVTAFVSIAAAIVLPSDFLPVALAAQLFAVAWLNGKLDVTALRPLGGILAGVFAALLACKLTFAGLDMLQDIVMFKTNSGVMLTFFDIPLVQLALPSCFFFLGAWLYLKEKDNRLVRFLEIGGIVLATLAGYYLIRHAFHMDDEHLKRVSFVECGVLTNFFFIAALAALEFGRRYNRQAITQSGLVLFILAMARLIFYGMFVNMPLWAGQEVGDRLIFNALLVVYGLPLVWMYLAERMPAVRAKHTWSRFLPPFILVLAFVFINLNVRHFFHGTRLDLGASSNLEIYTYSISWLLFGVGLLLYGTWKNDKMVRIASLIVMILTVGKVFLYDAAALKDLLRILSFLGLGISLLALSWFYTRFVFANDKQRKDSV